MEHCFLQRSIAEAWTNLKKWSRNMFALFLPGKVFDLSSKENDPPFSFGVDKKRRATKAQMY